MRKSICRPILATALLLACAALARADSTTVIYDSNGFEIPRFLDSFVNAGDPTVTGNLRGQDTAPQPKWVQSGTAGGMSAGTATVQAAIGYSGQGVRVERTTNEQYWFPQLDITPNVATSRWVNVSWKMKVTQTTTDLNKYGPFFGIMGYDASGTPLKLGAFGVDATTGELLALYPGGLDILPDDPIVSFDAWHDYKLSFDYQDKTYAGYVDGIEVVSGVPFFDSSATKFTDADIAAIRASLPSFSNEAGVAYFDDYVVSTFVPEPSTALALVGLASAMLLRRRRV